MSWFDYIKIRGYDGTASGADPGTFEVFQGLGGCGDASASAWEEGNDGFEISEGLWAAQGVVITRQSESLSALSDHLGDSISQGGFWGIINAIFKPVLEEIIQQAIAEAIEHAWGIPDDLAEVITSFFMGLWEGILEALDEFDQGHAQCNALIDENTALLAATISYQNYNLRADVLARHENIIARLSANIEKGKSSIWEALDALLKFAGLFTSDKEDNDDWVSIFDSIESAITNMDSWMQNVYTADAADPQLPVPMPPQLPTLPDKNKSQPSKAIMFYMAKLAIKLFTEWLRRHKEHDPDVAEGLERAFFFNDPEELDPTKKRKSIFERGLLKTVTEDEKNKVKALIEKAFFFDDPEEEDINKKMKSILDRGLLKTITEDEKNKVKALIEKAFFFDDPEEEDINKKMKSILDRGLLKTITEDDKDKVIALLEILDQDLALVDATIDFGTFRILVKGKTIQYG